MKRCLLVIYFVVFCLVINAQKSNSNFSIDVYCSDRYAGVMPVYLQGNYFFYTQLSSGFYFGYSEYDNTQYSTSNYFVGNVTRYYVADHSSAVSPYVSAKLGFIINNTKGVEVEPYGLDPQSTVFDYGLYAGVRVKIYRSFSSFVELGYGKEDIVRGGLSFAL